MILSSIISFFQPTYTMKKADVYKYLDFSIKSIKNDIIPSIRTISDMKGLKFVKNNNFFTYIYKSSGVSAKDNYQALDRFEEFFTRIEKSNTELTKLIDRHMMDIISNKSMTAKTAAILRVLMDINAMSSYMSDLLLMLVTDEKDTSLPPIAFKRVRELAGTFINLVEHYYTAYDKIIKELQYVSEDLIDGNTIAEEDLINVSLQKSSLKLPTTNNFIGNPIYTFRCWLVDREIAKYERLKEQKRLIELKVMELKLRDENENDPSLKKQIEYYEEKIASLDYKINKIENDQ